MAQVTYDSFFSWVLPEVNGCPEITAIQAIRDTVISFCEGSLIHQVDHDPVSSITKIGDYDLEAPIKQTRIVKVMKAWYMGRELEPISPDEVRDPGLYNPAIGGQYTHSYSTPRQFLQKDSASITLNPIPDQGYANVITMRVALAPTRTSDSCEDFLFEQWAEGIAAGAVAKLQSASGKPYSNPQLAGANQSRYIVALNAARQKSVRGYNRSVMTMKLKRRF